MTAQQERFNQVLDDCLDQVLRQGDSIEACIRRYPEHSAELGQLLRLALGARQSLDFIPSAEAKSRARLALDKAIREREVRGPKPYRWGAFRAVSGGLAGSYRWAASAAAALLLVVVGGTGVVAASSGSQPDEALYPVKRAVEQAQSAITFGDDSKARLHASFADRRIKEMGFMAVKGDKRRVQRLSADIDHHLRQVQRAAFPEVRLPVLELETVPETNGLPGLLPEGIAPLPPGLAKERRRPGLQRLNKLLEEGLAHQAQVLPPAAQRAPEQTKEELLKAHRTAQYKYRALIQVIDRLTWEK